MDLTVTTFLTLDGVMQAPGGPDEDRSGGFGFGGWLVPFVDETFGRHVEAWFARADEILFGRTTYQMMAAFWPQVTDPADSVARALNTLPKHVVSRTLSQDDLTWEGARLLEGDVVEAVTALKERPGRELQVHGSAGLVQTLLAAGLVDELRLITFPVVLGTGKRLFGDSTQPAAWTAGTVEPTSTGAVVATYRYTGAPTTGDITVEDGVEVVHT
jgi:dihydrofolate reductase